MSPFIYRQQLPEYWTETFTKQCRRCGTTFATQSRVKKRCDPCQESVAASRQKVYEARIKARKANA